MEFTGKVHVREIDRKPLELKAESAETWVKGVLERAAPAADLTQLEATQWAEKSQYQGEVRVEKVGSDYMVQGAFKATVPAPCSRCGDLFTVDRAGKYQVFLSPTLGEKEPSDDPDYIPLESEEIDLRDILSEQIIVQEAVAECPAKLADGSCSLCHKNPSFESGQESDFSANSQLSSQLARLKISDR